MEVRYTLHHLTPRVVESPAGADELAAILRQATIDGAGVVPWGAGTRQHLGLAPTRYDIALCTQRLRQVVDYTPADLVLQIEAGATLGEVQALLANHGQWLPWDPPRAQEASIGGLLATAASGPLRLAYGPPRDWTLSLHVAFGDGRLVTSGAKVVKNVAGYDAHKLHLGALGTLGVIVAATFKLAPLPEHRQTLLVALDASRLTLETLEQFRAAPLSPISLVVLNHTAVRLLPALGDFVPGQPTPMVLIALRFAGVRPGVERQIREAVRRSVDAGARYIDLDEQDDTPIWQAIADFARHALPGDTPTFHCSLMLRAGIRPAYLLHLLRLMQQSAHGHGWPAACIAYAGVGLAYAHWWLPDTTGPGEVVSALGEIRAAASSLGGYLVVEDGPAPLRPAVDIWGTLPETLGLMRSLKAQWDPGNVLNPGRYVV